MVGISVLVLFGLSGCGVSYSTEDAPPSKDNAVGYSKSTSTFTVNDSNLTWQDTESIYTSTAFPTWVEANQYCNDLELEGFNDWRLPSTSEYNKDLYPHISYVTYQLFDYYDTYGNFLFWTSYRDLYNGDYDLAIYNISNGKTIIFKESLVTASQSTRCVRYNK